MITHNIFVVVLTVSALLNGCAAVRMAGRVASAAGHEMERSADEEEAKKKAGLNAGNNTESANSVHVMEIKEKFASVKVRTAPSAKKPVLATLTGGDKVEKLAEKKGWVKIRFNTGDDEGEGWIKSDAVQPR